MKYMQVFVLTVGLLMTACGPAALPNQDSNVAQPGSTVTVVSADVPPATKEVSPTSTLVPQPTQAPAQPTQAPAQPTQAPAQPTQAPAQPTSVPQPVQPTSVPAQPTAVVDGEWKTVAWEGLQIPVPAEDNWEAGVPANEQVNGYPVLAAGRIMDNPSGDAHDDQHTDHPTDEHGDDHTDHGGSAFDGPIYIILQTTDSLDQWLERERKNEVSAAGNRVEDATIRDMTIAGRPAKAYQRAIIGLALTEYYVVKISDDKLLWITTYNAEDTKYRHSIDQLVIQAQ
jgi:hypothetical protein